MVYFLNVFNGVFRNSDNVALNDWMAGNNEIERMQKEEVVA
jgi:hypothetical protein